MTAPAIFLRFDEPPPPVGADPIPPSDDAGGLADLKPEAGETTAPAVAYAYAGYGREFVPGDATGLMAADATPGATLCNRDCTVRALLRWDFDAQDAAGEPGAIIVRGLDESAAEYWAYGLELRVVNVAARAGELRWFWQTVAGVERVQVGGQFRAPTDDGFLLFTATRRWISSSEAELAYYIGGELLARHVTSDGDIGGGTTGTTTVGARHAAGSWDHFLAGVIDEIQVIEEALTHEEIRATWERIAKIQPGTVQLVLECHPPGFPISGLPESRVQRENRGIGHALGYAAAQTENMRANLMPDRAYGDVLRRWETITGQHARARDSVERRRSRVVAHIRQRAGVSPPAVQTMLEELYAELAEDIELLAYGNTIVDASPVNTRRWRDYGAGTWTLQGGAARGQSSVDEDIRLTGPMRNWATHVMALDGEGPGARLANAGREVDAIVKVTPTLVPAGVEVGIFAENRATGNRVLVGYRGVAPEKFYRTIYAANVLVSETIIDDAPAIPTPFWLRLRMASWIAPGESATFDFLWSTTSGVAGFTGDAGIACSNSGGYNRFGFYLQAPSSLTHTAVDVAFDDVNLRQPYGLRPFHAYAYRDPGLPGEYDLVGALLLLRRVRQLHTHAAAIDSLDVLYDHDGHGYDAGPLGGI